MHVIGDIGGTSSRLALAQDGALVDGSVWAAPAGQDDLADILRAFRSDRCAGLDVQGVAIAGAGALRGDVLPLTNRSMVLDPGVIRTVLGNVPVSLFNDMIGQGYGLDAVPRDATRHLAGPDADTAGATRLVVNIGTGLNAAPVFTRPDGPFVPVTEAGNVTLPQTNAELRDLARDRGGEVVVEDVLSGRALPLLAQALTGTLLPPQEALAQPKVQALIAACLAGFLRDMVLTHMARGGIWLTGSVAQELAQCLDWQDVHRAMVGQRAYTDILSDVPIRVVTDPHITLRGAARLSAGPG